MDAQTFVNALKEVVIEESVKSVQANLFQPPGRKPPETLLAMSKWYNGLKDDEKSLLIQIIRDAVETSVFGFLCVLDGVRVFQDGGQGSLTLYY